MSDNQGDGHKDCEHPVITRDPECATWSCVECGQSFSPDRIQDMLYKEANLSRGAKA